MTAVVTVVGTVCLVVLTLGFALVASIFGWLGPRGAVFFRLARVWTWLWLKTSGVKVTAHFAQPLDPQRGYVFMANHQSWYDIPALITTLPGAARFLAKKGLFQLPIVGWAMQAGAFIAVDRQDKSTARDTFATAARSLADGHSVLLFPEETRSPDGQLLPFKKGGFLLALKSQLPIVPVGIAGTRAVRPKGSCRIRPGPVTVHYGRPLDPAAFGLRGRDELMAVVRSQIAELARSG